MFTLFALLSLALSVVAMPAPSEWHEVNLINRCGSGTPVFISQGTFTPRGSTTVTGPLKGGVAWMDGMTGVDCQMSGVGCGTVEFTLINSGVDAFNTDNSINYSLQSYGDHRFTYDMNFGYKGSCTRQAPGACKGGDAISCPGAFLGTATAGGTPINCIGDNAGITITFC